MDGSGGVTLPGGAYQAHPLATTGSIRLPLGADLRVPDAPAGAQAAIVESVLDAGCVSLAERPMPPLKRIPGRRKPSEVFALHLGVTESELPDWRRIKAKGFTIVEAARIIIRSRRGER